MRGLNCFLILVFGMIGMGNDIQIIENPTSSCREPKPTKLTKMLELKESESSEAFLVKPVSLVVDDQGYIYVYDSIQVKFFKYDKNLKLTKTFGSKGQGPGEISGTAPQLVRLFYSRDTIFFGDTFNKKIICFSTNGKYIREVSLRERNMSVLSPAIDSKGNIYLHGDRGIEKNSVVDCYDIKGKYLRGYLDRNNLKVGLFMESKPKPSKVKGGIAHSWYASDPMITYTITASDQLLVYSSTSGYLWVFSNGRLKRKVGLWPEAALLDYQEHLKKTLSLGGFFPFFRGIIINRDLSGSFLLHYGYRQKGNSVFVYQFNVFGELEKVFSIQNPKKAYLSIKYKKNNTFYAIERNSFGNMTIALYREDKDA